MTTLKHRFTRTGNRIGAWLYRRGDGLPGSKNADVLLMTVPGRRTGSPRSTCMRFIERPEGLVVWGTGSGSRQDPDWFRNLRAAERVDLQVRDRRMTARARELLGPERDAMWNEVIVPRAPYVTKYARKSGRTIPVAVLEPVEASGA